MKEKWMSVSQSEMFEQELGTALLPFSTDDDDSSDEQDDTSDEDQE